MRDVPVPPGLRSRLVLALADPDVPSSASGVPALDGATQWGRTRTNRRRWIAASLAAVVALACGVSWQLLHQGASAPLSLATVRQYWADQVRRLGQAPALPDFNAHWDPRIQDGRWAGLALPGPPRGADLDGDGRHDAAMYPLRGGACLVVLAPGRIGDPPTSGSALAATKYYEPMAHVAWTIGEQVYVCYVPAGGDALRQLLVDVYQNVG